MTEPHEFVALSLKVFLDLPDKTFGEGFKSSSYLGSAKCSESQLEAICTKHKYSSVQKKFHLNPSPNI